MSHFVGFCGERDLNAPRIFREIVVLVGADCLKRSPHFLPLSCPHRGVRVPSTPATATAATPSSTSAGRREEKESLEKRKKKKAEYLKHRKMELEKEAELASKYRDRAKERRAHQDAEDDGDKKAQEKVGALWSKLGKNTDKIAI